MVGGGAFEGQLAVVTGAASGLGRGIAGRFAAAGCRLVLADVEEAALARATAELADAGAEATAVPTDVSDAASMDALARRCWHVTATWTCSSTTPAWASRSAPPR